MEQRSYPMNNLQEYHWFEIVNEFYSKESPDDSLKISVEIITVL